MFLLACSRSMSSVSWNPNARKVTKQTLRRQADDKVLLQTTPHFHECFKVAVCMQVLWFHRHWKLREMCSRCRLLHSGYRRWYQLDLFIHLILVSWFSRTVMFVYVNYYSVLLVRTQPVPLPAGLHYNLEHWNKLWIIWKISFPAMCHVQMLKTSNWTLLCLSLILLLDWILVNFYR
jgi:hypothetical protein